MFFQKIDIGNRIRHLSVMAVILLSGAICAAAGAAPVAQTDSARILEQSRDLKQSSAQLNAELIDLERQLLYPTETQLAFFVAMDEGSFFQLKQVELFIDDKKMAKFDYNPKQVYALQMGGDQRFFMGNYPAGEYNVKAVIHGVGPWGRPYRRIAALDVKKTPVKATQLELRVIDGSDKYRPEFEIKEWK